MGSWQRTFRVVWVANLVTSIGMMSFLPFFPSLLEEMGVTDEGAQRIWAGVLFGAAPFGATIMSPIWGALGDRVGRKLMICRAMCAIAVFVGGMAFASGPWTLLALRLGQGFFSGFIPPSMTLVTSLVPAERAGRTTGALTTSLAIGAVVGPALGAWLATALGSRQSVFLFVGGAAAVSAVLVALFAQEDASQRQQVERTARPIHDALTGIRQDVRSVFSHPLMAATAMVIFCVQFGLGATNSMLELFVQEVLAGSGTQHWTASLMRFFGNARELTAADIATFANGLAFGAMALANLFTLKRWGAYGDRVGHRKAIVQCSAVCFAGLVLQVLAWDFASLLVGRVVMGVGTAGIGPLAFGLAAAEVSADRRGSAFGVVFSARTLAVAAGGALGGTMAAVAGLRSPFAVGAVIVLLGVVAFRRVLVRVPESSAGTSPDEATAGAGDADPVVSASTPAVASSAGKADRSS